MAVQYRKITKLEYTVLQTVVSDTAFRIKNHDSSDSSALQVMIDGLPYGTLHKGEQAIYSGRVFCGLSLGENCDVEYEVLS